MRLETRIHRHADGAIDFGFYARRARDEHARARLDLFARLASACRRQLSRLFS